MQKEQNKENLYQKAVEEAEIFFAQNKYTSSSDVDVLNKIFIESLNKYLNSSDQISLWNLGVIAEEFEANPSIHLSEFGKEIYLAIDLVFYLFEDMDVEISANIDKLKKFLEENK